MDWRGLISFLVGLLESGNDQDFHFGIKLLDDKEIDVECCQNIDDSSRSIKKKLLHVEQLAPFNLHLTFKQDWESPLQVNGLITLLGSLRSLAL